MAAASHAWPRGLSLAPLPRGWRLQPLSQPSAFASAEHVRFIDYEYTGYNYQAFDIGNHFNEFAGESGSSPWHQRPPPDAAAALGSPHP